MITTELTEATTAELLKRKEELNTKIQGSIDYTAGELSEFMEVCRELL